MTRASNRTNFISLNPDPRTKFILIVLCIVAATIAPALKYNLMIVAAVALFGILLGRWRYALIGIGSYALIYALTGWATAGTEGTARGVLLAFFGLVHKVYPCGMMAALVVRTTKVSEFLAAMNRARVPKKIVIPIAVLLRYLPAIREDWFAINDAMRMRDVNPSLIGFLTKPVMTVQCIYVPLMMSASKAADELSIASLTRGIDNPARRGSLVQVRPGITDIVCVCGFMALLILGFVWR